MDKDERIRQAFQESLEDRRGSIQFGLMAFRVSLLINAGSLIALLAFMGQAFGALEHEFVSSVISQARPFVYGMILAAISTGLGYLYQALLEGESTAQYDQLIKDPTSPFVIYSKYYNVVKKINSYIAIIMIIAVICSYVAFAWGAINVISVLESNIS